MARMFLPQRQSCDYWKFAHAGRLFLRAAFCHWQQVYPPLLLLLLAAFAVLAAMHEKEFSRENWDQLRTILPDLLFLLGGILTLFGTKMYLDSAYHPTWGDRSDGRKLRSLDPMAVVANYIMPTRVGSSNFIRESVDDLARWSAISAKSASRALRISA